MYLHLSSWVLVAALFVVVGGAVAVGYAAGRYLRARTDTHTESIGVVQGTLLGLVGLLLAFGLTMAVGRYEARRSLVVQEANALGTTFLRAQMLTEPSRTDSIELLERYTDAAIDLADEVPDTDRFDADVAEIAQLQRDLWTLAGDAVRADPQGTAPRLYVETLNETIDTHTSRVASLRNRVPPTVVLLQVLGSAIALGVLSLYLTLLGRGLITSLVAAGLVILILFISFDLDRPQRGLITVPFGPLIEVRHSMELPAAATGP